MSGRARPWTSLAAGVLALSAAALAGEAERPAPPIRKVVLYKHGIGYFERSGRVSGDALLRMNFKAAQMKDLLTSFFALDLGGGQIGAIRYDTKDPITKQLEGILVDVPETQALSTFLTRLKGTPLRVWTSAGETYSGRVMGTEPIVERIGGEAVRTGYRLVILDDQGAVRSADLFSLVEISIQDEDIRRDLARLLEIHRASKSAERKTVTIECRGAGEREVRIGYLIETPIWKASYRVIFSGEEPPLVQGWALAENTTEEDWEGVQVSFVAGNPLSYVMDLYTPYYPKRQEVPIPGLAASAVNWEASPEASALAREKAQDRAEAGEFALAAGAVPGRKAALTRGAPAAPAAARDAAEPEAEESLLRMESREVRARAESSVAAAAAALKVGELFAYESKSPVTVPRGKAAMVPILSEKIPGERVVYYKRAFSPRPVNAFMFKNTTALTLEAGAVTFFEGATSLGEGILSHVLVAGSKEIVPYALEAAISVEPRVDSRSEPFRRGVFADGVLTLYYDEKRTAEYNMSNKGKEPRTLLVDHPRNMAYKLETPAKPEEEVEGHYRFRTRLEGGKSEKLQVVETREVSQVFHVQNASLEQIASWMEMRFFSAAARKWMKEVQDILAARAELQRRVSEMEAETRRLTDEQARLRNNMNALQRGSAKEEALRAKFVTQLEAAETRLVELKDQLNEAGRTRLELEDKLARKVREYKGE